MTIPENPNGFLLSLQDNENFFVEYLLRVYDVINAQVAPALVALGAGVLDTPDETSLLAVGAPLALGFTLSAGAAIVESSEYGPSVLLSREDRFFSWLDLGFDYASWLEDGAGPRFLLAAGRYGGDRSDDSRTSNAFELQVSETVADEGAVVLARLELGAEGAPLLLDARVPSRLFAFARQLLALGNEISELQARVQALETPADADPDAGVTGAAFNALKARVKQNEEAIAGLAAQIVILQAANDLFPTPFDLLGQAIGAGAVGLGEVNPPAIERLQISVVGANFGHGQNDTPDWTPDTNDPLELPFHLETGAFGP